MDSNQLRFVGSSFCFTGTMSGMKRTQAEREVRARGGLTCDVVNEQLSYLVVGDIPSPGWKHGDYGRKIEKAREISLREGSLKLVSEGTFMEGLAAHPPTGSGAIDEKVMVCNYKFLTAAIELVDVSALERWLMMLQGDQAVVSVRGHYAAAYAELYGGEAQDLPTTALIVECRIVKQMPLHEAAGSYIEKIERGFEAIRGVDGRLKWFERAEGSADYIRLLRELPQNVRLLDQVAH